MSNIFSRAIDMWRYGDLTDEQADFLFDEDFERAGRLAVALEAEDGVSDEFAADYPEDAQFIATIDECETLAEMVRRATEFYAADDPETYSTDEMRAMLGLHDDIDDLSAEWLAEMEARVDEVIDGEFVTWDDHREQHDDDAAQHLENLEAYKQLVRETERAYEDLPHDEIYKTTETPRHSNASDAELIDGFEVYRDDDTAWYVAAHPTLPVSSCGLTRSAAVENAAEALDLYTDETDD